jgi:hypothetical protein
VVPCAGGSLLTKIAKAMQELQMLGLIPESRTRMYAAQAAGCGPIVTMIKKDTDVLEPVRPRTICKSLAIGNPADGYYAYRAVKDSGGHGEHATDEEIIEGMRLLARTEGIFAETAGGDRRWLARLARDGVVRPDEAPSLHHGTRAEDARRVSLHVGPTAVIPRPRRLRGVRTERDRGRPQAAKGAAVAALLTADAEPELATATKKMMGVKVRIPRSCASSAARPRSTPTGRPSPRCSARSEPPHSRRLCRREVSRRQNVFVADEDIRFLRGSTRVAEGQVVASSRRSRAGERGGS